MAITTTYTLNKSAGKNTGNLVYTNSIRVDGATTNIASAEVVELFKIPKGAIITFLSINVVTVEGGTSTITVGDAVDPDRYRTSTNLNASAAYLGTNTGYVYPADDTVDATFSANAVDAAIFDVSFSYIMNENAD